MKIRQVTIFIIPILGNTFIGTILLTYFFFSTAIIFITSGGAKTTCNRLEPNYIVCEQEELRIDRLIKKEKTSFRLIDAVIKSKSQIAGFEFSYNSNIGKPRFQWKKKYDLYLKTDNTTIFYNYYFYLPHGEEKLLAIKNYIKGEPLSSFLNVNQNTWQIYLHSKDFLNNINILLIGWIILLGIITPIFKKINKSS